MNKFQPAIKYGIYLGLVIVVFNILIYALYPEMFLNDSFSLINGTLIGVAAPIIFMILGARDCKPNFEEYEFGKAFSAAFLVGVVAMAISLMYSLLFNTVIDPEFGDWVFDEKMQQELIKMEEMGYDEQVIEQSIGMARKFKQFTTGFLGVVFMSGILLVWYLILALIIGAVQKEGKRIDNLTS
jgi:hypothetical protein